MFFGDYSKKDIAEPDEEMQKLLDSVTPIYWDYHITSDKEYSDKIIKHKQISKNTWYAGAAWGWFGIIPHNRFTLQTMIVAKE